MIESQRDVIRRAVAFTRRWEGGYANHPLDPGGATMYGVIQRTYDSYRQKKGLDKVSVKGITEEETLDIYTGYWRDCASDRISVISERAAIANFDCAINCGSGTAIKLIQRAAQAKDDGIFGPATASRIAEWVNIGEDAQLVRRIIHQRHLYYSRICRQNTNLITFLEGWLKRCWDLQSYLVD